MGCLTTHVLDTARGKPGRGIIINLYRVKDDAELIKTLTTNADGRTDEAVLSENEFSSGTYELEFDVEAYFANNSVNSTQSVFLSKIPIRFTLSDDEHYHIPLLVSPFSYSTYRGS